MATLVTFHAHPDDESITCGGVMRKAYEDGHRVVLVVATNPFLMRCASVPTVVSNWVW